MPTAVAGPIFDRTRNRWVVRWTDDDGKRRTHSRSKTKEEASAFAASLIQPDESLAAGLDGEIAELIAGYDGSASWWDKAHGWLACRILEAIGTRAGGWISVLKDAASAFGTLANSQTRHRDRKRLEAVLRRLQAREREITQSVRGGTRLDVASASRGT